MFQPIAVGMKLLWPVRKTEWTALVRDHRTFVRSSLNYSDICLIPQVYNANRFGVPMENYPNISRVHSNLG